MTQLKYAIKSLNYSRKEHDLVAFFPSTSSGGAFYRSYMIQQLLASYIPHVKVLEYGADEFQSFGAIPIDEAAPLLTAAHFYCATLDCQVGIARQLRDGNKVLRIVHDMDDNYFVENQNDIRLPDRAYDNIRKMCDLADILTVTTDRLREAVWKEYPEKDIRVIPNTIHKPLLDGFFSARKAMSSHFRKLKGKPRVLWVGGLGHDRDFPLVESIMQESGDTFEWVLFGNYPPDRIPDGISVENIPNKDFSEYWTTLLGLDVDMIINPLDPDATINQFRSPIKFLETLPLGVPFLTNADWIYPPADSLKLVDGIEPASWMKAMLEPQRMDSNMTRLHVLEENRIIADLLPSLFALGEK